MHVDDLAVTHEKGSTAAEFSDTPRLETLRGNNALDGDRVAVDRDVVDAHYLQIVSKSLLVPILQDLLPLVTGRAILQGRLLAIQVDTALQVPRTKGINIVLD